jgi:hypothetical protein
LREDGIKIVKEEMERRKEKELQGERPEELNTVPIGY